jgi:hypothetical protein
MPWLRQSVPLFFAAMLISPLASALVVFDSLSPACSNPNPALCSGSINYNVSSNSGTPSWTSLAQSFSTTAGGSVGLSEVTLRLDRNGAAQSQEAIQVNLLGDSSTHPGSLISQLGTIDASLIPLSTFSDFILSIQNVSLAADTRYWIELSDPGFLNSSVAWDTNSPRTRPGAASESSFYPGGVTQGFAFQMQVVVDPANSVPEPGSLLLVGTAIAALGFARRKQA